MSPTIVLKDGHPVLAVGSPSGPRIITCVAHTILNYLEYKMPLAESVAALRYHQQWYPDELQVEPPSFPAATARALEGMGYKIHVKDLGCRVEAVARENGQLHGVADPRADGMAVGN
jgi:gamma-glutamyltranspeptidase/glutathione hydrolase